MQTIHLPKVEFDPSRGPIIPDRYLPSLVEANERLFKSVVTVGESANPPFMGVIASFDRSTVIGRRLDKAFRYQFLGAMPRHETSLYLPGLSVDESVILNPSANIYSGTTGNEGHETNAEPFDTIAMFRVGMRKARIIRSVSGSVPVEQGRLPENVQYIVTSA